jgi:hypothetical protein
MASAGEHWAGVANHFPNLELSLSTLSFSLATLLPGLSRATIGHEFHASRMSSAYRDNPPLCLLSLSFDLAKAQSHRSVVAR